MTLIQSWLVISINASPLLRAPKTASEALKETFREWTIVTKGPIPDLSRGLIDHIAVPSSLACTRLKAIPRRSERDVRLSDHNGIVADLALQSSATE